MKKSITAIALAVLAAFSLSMVDSSEAWERKSLKKWSSKKSYRSMPMKKGYTPKSSYLPSFGSDNKAEAIQRGTLNGAAISQRGNFQFGHISQDGAVNNAELNQRGNFNTGLVNQRGEVNNAGVSQFGNNNVGVVLQNGGFNSSQVEQVGKDNVAVVATTGVASRTDVIQNGGGIAIVAQD